jgi:hypothetical protein
MTAWNPTFRKGRETWGTRLVGGAKTNGQKCPF